MEKFPLYESLNKDALDKDLTEKQKNDFVKKIPGINVYGGEILYILIKMYELDSKDESLFELPYEGIYGNEKSMIFDLNKFPNKLKQILFKFLNIHTKTLKEEESIKKRRDKIELLNK